MIVRWQKGIRILPCSSVDYNPSMKCVVCIHTSHAHGLCLMQGKARKMLPAQGRGEMQPLHHANHTKTGVPLVSMRQDCNLLHAPLIFFEEVTGYPLDCMACTHQKNIDSLLMHVHCLQLDRKGVWRKTIIQQRPGLSGPGDRFVLAWVSRDGGGG